MAASSPAPSRPAPRPPPGPNRRRGPDAARPPAALPAAATARRRRTCNSTVLGVTFTVWRRPFGASTDTAEPPPPAGAAIFRSRDPPPPGRRQTTFSLTAGTRSHAVAGRGLRGRSSRALPGPPRRPGPAPEVRAPPPNRARARARSPSCGELLACVVRRQHPNGRLVAAGRELVWPGLRVPAGPPRLAGLRLSRPSAPAPAPADLPLLPAHCPQVPPRSLRLQPWGGGGVKVRDRLGVKAGQRLQTRESALGESPRPALYRLRAGLAVSTSRTLSQDVSPIPAHRSGSLWKVRRTGAWNPSTPPVWVLSHLRGRDPPTSCTPTCGPTQTSACMCRETEEAPGTLLIVWPQSPGSRQQCHAQWDLSVPGSPLTIGEPLPRGHRASEDTGDVAWEAPGRHLVKPQYQSQSGLHWLGDKGGSPAPSLLSPGPLLPALMGLTVCVGPDTLGLRAHPLGAFVVAVRSSSPTPPFWLSGPRRRSVRDRALHPKSSPAQPLCHVAGPGFPRSLCPTRTGLSRSLTRLLLFPSARPFPAPHQSAVLGAEPGRGRVFDPC